jgi:hypothetical protein
MYFSSHYQKINYFYLSYRPRSNTKKDIYKLKKNLRIKKKKKSNETTEIL